MNLSTQQTLDLHFRSQLQDFGTRHDPVTGLPNHAAFRTAIRGMLDEAVADGQQVALLWIDILNLRHEYSIGGDEGVERLVRTVADSLRLWVDPEELICRFSDHCFLLALKCDSRTEVRLSQIFEASSQLHMEGWEGKPEIAAGAAWFPSQAASPDELIRFASLAAASATRTRSHSLIHFHPDMNASLLYERALEKDLRAALRDNQLTHVYQPQIDLNTGRVIGAESLMRWSHPTRGAVSPLQFIPVAERSNLIDEIFAQTLRQTLGDAASWRAAGIELDSIAINASPANIRQEGFVARVQRALQACPPGRTRLEIEVTESLLMDDEELFLERLHSLREIGVLVSLDDFGTRYTGFNALKGLPLHAMKIDKCFVHEINRSNQAQALCRTIVTMGRHLQLSTIAEGIEDAGELRILKKIGCDSGQGHLFQRPCSPQTFLRFLEEWPERMKQPEFAGVFSNPSHTLPAQSLQANDPSADSDQLLGVA